SLMLGWLIWLGWQANLVAPPSRVSRPQLDLAHLIVRVWVEVAVPSRWVVADWEVLRGPAREPGTELTLVDLDQVQGWQGPGFYVIPLVPGPEGTFRVAPIPYSPGYVPAGGEVQRLIYPDRALVRELIAL
ncbi:MAG TPA: hypothetical protein PKD86_16165, partial [Gemmatales bacterium]|nr:hypothetical protein [Gemmatales bacterium]